MSRQAQMYKIGTQPVKMRVLEGRRITIPIDLAKKRGLKVGDTVMIKPSGKTILLYKKTNTNTKKKATTS